MSFLKNSLAVFVAGALLTGCGSDDDTVERTNLKVATFNLSFDRNDFETLKDELQTSPSAQTALIQQYLNGELPQICAEEEQNDGTMEEVCTNTSERTKAEKIIQIRNVAAIIQRTRPDVLMLAEFNNDGTGEDKTALIAFQDNYLSVPQSEAGAGGEANLAAIEYPFFESYATNTGLVNEFGFDLDNNGKGNDAWGFGFYHGQYAFALMSKHEIDTDNTRTFQTFKWKDLPDAKNPVVPPNSSEAEMGANGEWYTEAEWAEVRLSSKNHVDAPILVQTATGTEVVHLLMSHPTPPVFDTGKNKLQNAAEVEFWHQYIQGAEVLYDDKGVTGGLAQGEHFVIMGDLNLDAFAADGVRDTMVALQTDPLMNQDVVLNGYLAPVSTGAEEYMAETNKLHPFPERVTATFGAGVDYAMPSATLNVVDTGVYWPASYEDGNLLMVDERVGKYGNGKDISSDHRLIWTTIEF